MEINFEEKQEKLELVLFVNHLRQKAELFLSAIPAAGVLASDTQTALPLLQGEGSIHKTHDSGQTQPARPEFFTDIASTSSKFTKLKITTLTNHILTSCMLGKYETSVSRLLKKQNNPNGTTRRTISAVQRAAA